MTNVAAEILSTQPFPDIALAQPLSLILDGNFRLAQKA